MIKAYIFGLLLAGFLVRSDVENDRAQSGNFAMFRCGSGQPDSQAEKLKTLLSYTRLILREVLVDLKLGTASKHGFRSFFKSNTNLPHVKSVFEAIYEGEIPSTNAPILLLELGNRQNLARSRYDYETQQLPPDRRANSQILYRSRGTTKFRKGYRFLRPSYLHLRQSRSRWQCQPNILYKRLYR